MEKPRQIVAVIFATTVVAAFALGCGDGNGSGGEAGDAAPPSLAKPERAESSPPDAPADRVEPAEEPDGEEGEVTPPPSAKAAAERDSGGGADEFRVPNGDNSIQSFGEEADESERHAAAIVLHAFLQARAKEQWNAVCSYLSASVLDQVRQLATRFEEAQGESCEDTLAVVLPGLSGKAEAEITDADVGSLRVEGERAFILYRGAGDRDYTMTMTKEEGDWRIASLAPVPLP